MSKAFVKEIQGEYRSLVEAGATHEEAVAQIEISFGLHPELTTALLTFVL